MVWDGEDVIKVADLGLATLSTANGDDSFKTLQDAVAGTLDFMAPEQARGLGHATAASDVYALAATWFYLLTGESRVPGDNMRSKLRRILSGKKLKDLPPSSLPESLRDIWKKMIAYNPCQRIQSMADVINAIESVPTEIPAARNPSVKVLVVEDDADDLFLTLEMLRRANQSLEIVTAKTLRESVALCSQPHSIDLVLLDLRLPDSAGVETVERLKAILPSTPIVILTGQQDVEIGQACMAAGAAEFACKNDLTAHLMERMIFITLSRFQHKQMAASESLGAQDRPPNESEASIS